MRGANINIKIQKKQLISKKKHLIEKQKNTLYNTDR